MGFVLLLLLCGVSHVSFPLALYSLLNFGSGYRKDLHKYCDRVRSPASLCTQSMLWHRSIVYLHTLDEESAKWRCVFVMSLLLMDREQRIRSYVNALYASAGCASLLTLVLFIWCAFCCGRCSCMG